MPRKPPLPTCHCGSATGKTDWAWRVSWIQFIICAKHVFKQYYKWWISVFYYGPYWYRLYDYLRHSEQEFIIILAVAHIIQLEAQAPQVDNVFRIIFNEYMADWCDGVQH